MNSERLTPSQLNRVNAFKRDFTDLLKMHNVRFEISEDRYAHMDGECQIQFFFMTSDPTLYNGDEFSDMCLDAKELES
jgi:hypothetical protein